MKTKGREGSQFRFFLRRENLELPKEVSSSGLLYTI